ncbi:MAG TPA: DUF1028 domain-containing protein [Pseudonocardia sp.]|nr:DUF1028 domain-containing protein [Pseudonocardia sp.]
MTYSIVARDGDTGALAVACQSHFFGVGAAVNWAESGVGAVATQSFVDPSYGARGLRLLREEVAAPLALEAMLARDPHPELRQVAIIDCRGGMAVHTGAGCVGALGSRSGSSFLVQGNMLASDRVLDDMATAVDAAGPMVDRMLAAMRAAEAAGGDLRGSQAAGIRVVAGDLDVPPGGGILLDLRVDDASDPVAELDRLVGQHRLAAIVVEALFTEGVVVGKLDQVAADTALDRLAEVTGDGGEIGLEAQLWRGVVLTRSGRAAQAEAVIDEVVRRRPSLARFLANLREAGYLPDEEER